MKFSEFCLCFHNSCEICHLFSRAPLRNSLWTGVIADVKLYLWPLKNVKMNTILLKLFWYKVFCPLKIAITQFSDGFGLKT